MNTIYQVSLRVIRICYRDCLKPVSKTNKTSSSRGLQPKELKPISATVARSRGQSLTRLTEDHNSAKSANTRPVDLDNGRHTYAIPLEIGFCKANSYKSIEGHLEMLRERVLFAARESER